MLTPVDPPSRVRSMVITIDQAMEIDKAETIPMKTVAVIVSSWCLFVDEELIPITRIAPKTLREGYSKEVNHNQA